MDYLLIFQYLPGNQWIYHWSLAKQQERAADGWERPGRGHTSIAPRTDGSKVVSVRELNKTAENGSGTDDLPIFTYYNCINGDFSIDTSYRVTESNHGFSQFWVAFHGRVGSSIPLFRHIAPLPQVTSCNQHWPWASFWGVRTCVSWSFARSRGFQTNNCF